jgi:hypothetical protein
MQRQCAINIAVVSHRLQHQALHQLVMLLLHQQPPDQIVLHSDEQTPYSAVSWVPCPNIDYNCTHTLVLAAYLIMSLASILSP